jgi:hypothetical protein
MHILKLYDHNKFYVSPLCMINSFYSEGEELYYPLEK